MRLLSLRLHNIRSYAASEIIFPEGSLLLSGDIGTGKSSILQGIEFALFGLLRGVSDGHGLLRHGTNNASATLSFLIDGKTVTIHRTLQRTANSVVQGSGHLIVNGAKEEFTPTELKARIMHLFGYPDEQSAKSLLYRYTVYTSQERMKEIIMASPEIRLTTLRALFAIDKYKRAYDNVSVVITAIKQEIATIQGRHDVVAHQLMDKKQQLSMLDDAPAKVIEAQSFLSKTQQHLAELQKARITMEKTYDDVLALKQQWERIDAQEQTLRNQIADAKEKMVDLQRQADAHRVEADSRFFTDEPITPEMLAASKKELDATSERYHQQVREQLLQTSRLRELATQDESLQQALVPSKGDELRAIAADLEHKVVVLADRRKELIMLQEQLSTVREQMAGERLHHEQLQSRQQNILSHQVCPSCEQVVSNEHKNKVCTALAQQMQQCKDRLDELEKQRASLALFINESQQSIVQLEHFSTKLSQINVKLEQVAEDDRKRALAQQQLARNQELRKNIVVPAPDKTALDRAQQQYTQLYKQYMEHQQLLERKTRYSAILEEISKVSLLIDSHTTQIARIADEKSALKNPATALLEALSQLKTNQSQISSAQHNIQQALVALEQAKARQHLADLLKSEITATHAMIESIVATRQRLEQLKTWMYDGLRPLFTVMEKHVMISIYREFNAHFMTWCSLLLDDESTRVRLDNSFSPIVEQDGYDISLENMSGGERTSVALAYRLALNKVVNVIIDHIKTKDLLILDEPTEGFSPEQLDKVRVVLQKLDVAQLIIVSHEPKMETFVDHILRVRKDQHQSSIGL